MLPNRWRRSPPVLSRFWAVRCTRTHRDRAARLGGAQAMFLPRVALAWQANSKMVIRTGYGLYYDSLNATNQTPNQLGYSTTTTNVPSNDFGLTWTSGNPAGGISVLTDPFPTRADGSRFET